MRLVVDTGVFSAALSRRRRLDFEPVVAMLAGHQLFLALQTVAALRYGALVAQWGQARRNSLEDAIAATTVVPITDALARAAALLRFECRTVDTPSQTERTTMIWGSPPPRFTSERTLSPATESLARSRGY